MGACLRISSENPLEVKIVRWELKFWEFSKTEFKPKKNIWYKILFKKQKNQERKSRGALNQVFEFLIR